MTLYEDQQRLAAALRELGDSLRAVYEPPLTRLLRWLNRVLNR